MFTKKDLKTGYIVVCDACYMEKPEICMVLLGTANGDIVTGDTWFPLDSCSDLQLFGEIEDGNDIYFTKVLRPKSNMDYNLSKFNADDKSYELVWERKVESEQQKKIRELEETINKAQAQIEELKKEI